jgi:hypothetical protein
MESLKGSIIRKHIDLYLYIKIIGVKQSQRKCFTNRFKADFDFHKQVIEIGKRSENHILTISAVKQAFSNLKPRV